VHGPRVLGAVGEREVERHARLAVHHRHDSADLALQRLEDVLGHLLRPLGHADHPLELLVVPLDLGRVDLLESRHPNVHCVSFRKLGPLALDRTALEGG
jgi:hypothetical protein